MYAGEPSSQVRAMDGVGSAVKLRVSKANLVVGNQNQGFASIAMAGSLVGSSPRGDSEVLIFSTVGPS